MLKLNLQFFAEDNADQAANPEGQETQETGTDSQQSEETNQENTFTQEDVNNFVAKETKKQQEKLLKQLGVNDFKDAKEGMKKLKEFQESQMSEQEKQAQQLETLSGEKESLSKENQSLKAQMSALKAGVKGDSVEDVVALAERLVNDDVSMDDAVKQVIEKYPHFAEQQQEESKPSFTTGQHTKGGTQDSFAQTLLGK